MEAELEITESVMAQIEYMETKFQVLENILKDRCIKPVYQPIVSLTDGQIFGYEALSRISDKKNDINIMEMFTVAEKMNKTWELEHLCREKALESSVNMNKGKKLFLNVDPNIIHDEKFVDGFTKERLNRYGLNAGDVIFEITERVAVTDNELF
jgi:EAL domain-containing protein (putative c-di-GMP-specific phosphodiesterase class I)